MKKIIFILFACFACLQSASAQDYYESESDIYGLGNADYQKKWTKSLSLSLGTQAELGLTFRRNFGKFFAWDVWNFSYAYDYKDNKIKPSSKKYDVTHEITVFRTGVRGFTPNLGKVKLFAALGWGLQVLDRGKFEPAMGIDLQIGAYIGKKFNIAYQADFHKANAKTNHTDHMVRLAVDF